MIKCEYANCEDAAVHTVFWPGKTPPPKYCEKHAVLVIYTLKLAGTPVNFRPIVSPHTSESPSQKQPE